MFEHCPPHRPQKIKLFVYLHKKSHHYLFYVENYVILCPMENKVSNELTEQDYAFMKRAIYLAETGMNSGQGGPFGAIIVNSKREIIGEGSNSVTSTNDPTAHAEIVAIRNACKKSNNFQLDGCTIYTSCEPCPMCLGAIYWARPERIFYASSKYDAADIGFDDQFIYDEIHKENSHRSIFTKQIMQDDSVRIFKKWAEKANKTEY